MDTSKVAEYAQKGLKKDKAGRRKLYEELGTPQLWETLVLTLSTKPRDEEDD